MASDREVLSIRHLRKAINVIGNPNITMFPLTFKYSRVLHKEIKEDEFERIFELISQTVSGRKGNVIQVGHRMLKYKGSDSGGRYNIFNPVNYGIFEVQGKSKLTINYTINLTKTLLIGVLVSIIFGLGSQQLWFGIITFFMGGWN